MSPAPWPTAGFGVRSAIVCTLGAALLASSKPGEQSRLAFENRQEQSGVTLILNNGTTQDKPIIDSTLGGVALLDYDNDGYLDIFFTNGAGIPGLNKSNPAFSNRLYHNNHDGTYTDVTERAGVAGEGYSIGAAAADYDNDGWTDLYVTGVNRNILYHNNQDGTFTDVTQKAGVTAIFGLRRVTARPTMNDRKPQANPRGTTPCLNHH